MILALVAASALFVAAADPAQPDPAAPAKPVAASKTVDPAVVQGKGKDKDDPNQLVCKTETPIGSRLAVKKCMTKGEAAMRKFEDRQELERAQGDTYRR